MRSPRPQLPSTYAHRPGTDYDHDHDHDYVLQTDKGERARAPLWGRQKCERNESFCS